MWRIHDAPHDFFRFTKYGLRHLFEKFGMEIVALRAWSDFWATFERLLVYNTYSLNRVIHAIGLIVQAVANGLNRLDKTEQWAWMYIVVAKKKCL